MLLVYESSSSATGYEPLHEETVTLIRADSPAHAAARDREFGDSRQTGYVNEHGETIAWSLNHIVDVNEVTDAIGDGAETYTRHFRDHEAYRTFELLDLS